MAVLETNYDELDSKKIEISDSIVDVLETLSSYCDEHTVSYPNGCFNCPFYVNKIELTCLMVESGYGVPCNWAVYKDNGAGEPK